MSQAGVCVRGGAALGVVLASGLACSALAGGPTSAIALTGTDTALGPGMGTGVTFSGIGSQQPSINASGGVTFRGTESGTNSQGVWIFGGASNTNVALAGGAMPGGGTYTAGSTGVFVFPMLTDSGEWAVRLGGSTGVFATNAGTPTRVMLSGDVAPGTGGATFASVQTSAPRQGANGHVGFLANLTNATGSPPVTISGATANVAGLWSGPAGSATLQLRQNDALTELDAGGNVRVGSFNNLSLAINGSGSYAVTSNLQGSVTTGNTAGNAQVLVTNRSGSREIVARQGSAAPDATGAPSTDLYRALPTGALGFNSAGRIGFSTTLRDSAGVQTSTGSLFSDTVGGTMRQHARATTAMPTIFSPQGAPLAEFAGVTWGTTYNNIVIGGDDRMVFQASGLGNTGATNNTGAILSMDSSGVFTKVVRAGDVAIFGGAPLGGDALFQNNFSSIATNAVGQIAFQALLSGSGIFGGPGGNNSAMFGWDPNGGLCLIARTGDLFEAAPGDFRTISSLGGLSTSGGQDGRTRSINDLGQVAFTLDFTDGSSGIFVTTIPTPGGLALLALGGLVAGRRRR